MLKKLINKTKIKNRQIQSCKTNNDVIEAKQNEKIDIKISKADNIFKIEISDYISIFDFVDYKNAKAENSILDMLCNCVLWNTAKQKVNKGTYYVIIEDTSIYNILFADEKIVIDERSKKDIDEQTGKVHIIQERVITFNLNKNTYHYYSAKHDFNGDTYYTKYYDKNRICSLDLLYLTEEETYEEVKDVIFNLKKHKGIEVIFNLEILNEYILRDLSENFMQRKR